MAVLAAVDDAQEPRRAPKTAPGFPEGPVRFEVVRSRSTSGVVAGAVRKHVGITWRD